MTIRPRMHPLDLALYAWASFFLLVLACALPPLALIWLLFPRWHRRRMRLRGEHVTQLRNAAHFKAVARFGR